MEDNFYKYGNTCQVPHGKDELVIKEKINNFKRKFCESYFNHFDIWFKMYLSTLSKKII